MPFYEYQCGSCGHYLEAMQKITDAPLRKCPDCGRSTLKKLLSAPVFRLKGSGWYETDFKTDKDKKKNLVDESREEKPEDKKPDEKPKAEEAPKAAEKPKADEKPKPKALPKAKPARKVRKVREGRKGRK